METQQLTRLIKQELPGILQQNREMREWVIKLTKEKYADREEMESRFDRILDELRRDREENTRRWDEQNRKWEEQNRKWYEQNRKWEEQNRKWYDQNRKWEEQNRKWYEQNRKWDDQNRKWEEHNRKWEANQATIEAMLKEIQALSRKHESTIGALGARWGLRTEQSFRNALKGILTDSFDVEVINVTEFDDEGEVFGRPDQVKLDVIILNGTLILGEIKSSMSKSDMYTFERKARLYEKRHKRKADRLLVVSPMVDDQALDVARKLGIEVYSYVEDVPPELFEV